MLNDDIECVLRPNKLLYGLKLTPYGWNAILNQELEMSLRTV